MHYLLAVAAVVSAATIKINVGQGNTMTFTPDSVTAAVGDTLEFYFVGGQHDTIMSDFATPCKPSTKGGWSSGVTMGSASNVSRN
jgi:plastocyanin